MNHKSLFLATLVFFSFLNQLLAQTYTARLVDGKTNKAIPYATVAFGEHAGVITNDEGLFSFTLEANAKRLDSIYISSMGYEKTGFPFITPLDSILYLTPKAINLDGVFLFDKELSVEEIIEKMIANIPSNRNFSPIKQRYFLRNSEFANIHKLDFGFEKSSIEELNKELIDSIGRAVPRNTYHYTEALGDLYSSKEQSKIGLIKVAEMYNKDQLNSIEGIGDYMETIFKKHVKPSSYLKVKSGLFSQKIQVDSILTDMEEEEAKELASEIEKAKDTTNGAVLGQRWMLHDIYEELYYKEDSKLNIIDKYKRYDFSLKGYSDIDGNGVYVIAFEPKGKADFKGKLYINIDDFAVMRIDFENVKNLRNFRLLGIYYRDVTYKGTMRFGKIANGRYSLQFADLTFGKWVRIDRPLDVIEKNKHVKGRRKQNELRMNLDFQISNIDKYELVIFQNELIDEATIDNYIEDKALKPTYMPAYNANFWAGHNIMEPNAAIKSFKAEENN
jgi:hypothetical protein